MNALEKIAIQKLRCELIDALDNLHEKNESRQEHLRIHTRASVLRAYDILEALEENNKR